ncbi:MAG: TIGR01212 family radical SAM protein [Thermoguttaceae bacterium]|nr:TIGR01212 family radical SAM protein [Thermoguttaceae bacterium]
MTSIKPPGFAPSESGWRAEGLRYHSLGSFLRHRFGGRVWKVSLDGALPCPNTDGSLSVGGCVFCDAASYSPSRRLGLASVGEQLQHGIDRLRTRHRAERFLAYFQPGTNTYAPVERLRALYDEALAHPRVVGLIVGTRPDCVPDEVLDLLAGLARRTWVSIEYGLQTIHDRSLAWMNRGHDYAAFLDAVRRSRLRGLNIGAHVILGIPGETRDDMLATASEVARLRLDSVKLHNLYAVANTPLGAMVARGEVRLPELDEYVGWVVDFLERLPPQCVIDRLSGDAPPGYLLAPAWCRDKHAVHAAIHAELLRRDTWQGRLHG